MQEEVGGRRGTGLAVGLLALLGLAVSVVTALGPRASVEPVRGRAQEIPEDGYAGSQACRACHPHQYATWHASYHRTMTQVASAEAIVAPFDESELELEGTTWRVERRGEEFWVAGRPSDAPADAQPATEQRVVLTTGSHNYQVYWLEGEGDEGLQQFPLVYWIYEGKWLPRKSRFLVPPGQETVSETGRWRRTCIQCHATRGRMEHPDGGEPRVVQFGIACEACHGPAGEHAVENRAPARRYRLHLGEEPDDTIVNPADLSHQRSTEVCGQCHGVHFFRTPEELETWKSDGYSFRPGGELADSMAIVRGRFEDNDADVRQRLEQQPDYLENWFWRDGTVRVAGRELNGMLETPCYQRGEMSCLSCHVMHRPEDDPRSFREWTDDQLGAGVDGRGACVQCHAEYADEETVVAHTHHPADSSGSDCYNCHMPFTGYGLLKAVRSHVVESPDVAVSVATGRPNACNQCHLDRTLRWAADHLEAWYGVAQPRLSPDEEDVPASALWALRGDAAQRALMAWSFGWEDARAASGTDWMVPFLGVLMADPYDAVRFIAQRSLRSYPGFREIEPDGNMVPGREEQIELMKRFIESLQGRTPEPILDKETFDRLLEERDHRPVGLFE